MTCTYVCRSWNVASSAILWRHVRLWLQTSQRHRSGLVERLTHGPSKPKIQRFLDILSISQPLSVTVKRLHILSGEVDFIVLQNVVGLLVNLRDFKLQHVGFKPLVVKTYLPPRMRRSLDKLGLVGIFATDVQILAPQLLDTLVWFAAVDRLETYGQHEAIKDMPYFHPINIADQGDILTQVGHVDNLITFHRDVLKPQVPVRHLSLDGTVLRTLVPEANRTFDFSTLTSVDLACIDDTHLSLLHTFLHRHCRLLERLSIHAGIGTGFDHNGERVIGA